MDIKPITVEELNRYIKQSFDDDEFLNNVYVKGEISNFKNHYTGHLYFTLKDEKSLIKCVMFKSYTSNLNFEPKDGMKVCVFGTVSVFERDGVYQIYVKAIKEDGIGELYEAYEKLKGKLQEEGLFNEDHKKKIPLFSNTIGVITSSTGAVIKDIINVSTRRNPKVHIRLIPVPVQGHGASEKIAEAINKMNDENLADVIIIGRGGGSLEDLWPFNEEIVARAVYNSEIPIISAVGHETDFSIADFVADLRAPTPSAAAELAVPNISDIKDNLNVFENRFKQSLINKLGLLKLRYEKCITRRVFAEPLQKINEERINVDIFVKNIKASMELKLEKTQSSFKTVVTKLDNLSPLKTLARGYSIVEKDNKIIKSTKQLNKDDCIDINFSDGKIEAKII